MSLFVDTLIATTTDTTTTTNVIAATTTNSSNMRNVRCLIVGNDSDLASGSFALAVDENLSINELKQHVLRHMPVDSQQRIGSELQLFKGFDLYTTTTMNSATTSYMTPVKKAPTKTSSIDDLLQTLTPEKTTNKYFQRKYAMRKRASLGEYLPRGRKCEQSRIDVLVSVPKFQLSEDLAEMEEDEEEEHDTETEGLGEDFGGDMGYTSDAGTDDTTAADCAEGSATTATTPRKRKRDPVVDDAMTASASAMASPTKWQRAPCGRVVSVDTLRMRNHCKRCLSL